MLLVGVNAAHPQRHRRLKALPKSDFGRRRPLNELTERNVATVAAWTGRAVVGESGTQSPVWHLWCAAA